MFKSFFKVYVEIKKIIQYKTKRYLMDKNDLSCTCFEALDKYLNQYTWIRQEDEKICFDFCEDEISLAQVAEMNDMSYNTLRSLNSRVSARLYKRFGTDFKDVILGDDVKRKQELIYRCDVSIDLYDLKEHYIPNIRGMLEMRIDEVNLSGLDEFKITMKDLVTLKFLADYDIEVVFTKLDLIDIERLALFYHILSNKKCYDEKCQIWTYVNTLDTKS